LIPRELQNIIDQVSKSSVSAGRKTAALTSLGGVVGGLQQKRMGEAGEMSRLGITEAGATRRQGVSETGAMERTKLSATPGLMEQKRLGLEVPGSGAALERARGGGVGEPPTSILDDEDYYKSILK